MVWGGMGVNDQVNEKFRNNFAEKQKKSMLGAS
jgi:hypothetical protein